MTKSLESSDFTSVQERIEDRQSAQEFTSSDAEDQRTEHGPRAGWLCPLALIPPRKRVRERTSKRRCCNKGYLPMSLDQYLLLDWTGLDGPAAAAWKTRSDSAGVRSDSGEAVVPSGIVAGSGQELPQTVSAGSWAA
jgi:hypothetical protein